MICMPFTSIDTGREHPYYAHFTDEETEVGRGRNGFLQSIPPAQGLLITSLASASSTTIWVPPKRLVTLGC